MRRALAFLPLLLVYASCKEPTQIVVEARTNVLYQPGIVTSFTVGSPGQTERAEPTTETSEPWDGPLIGTLVVVPGSGDDATLAVKLVMGVARNARECVAPDYRGCIVARRRLRYVPNEKLRLPITLFAECQDVPCDELSTCSVLGQCVPVEPTCTDGTCELAGESNLGDGGVTRIDASTDASQDGSSDAAGDGTTATETDAEAGASDGGDAGPGTPGSIDCRGTTPCSTANGGHCCYHTDSHAGSCPPMGAECPTDPAVIFMYCDDDSDCAGQVCCYEPAGQAFKCRAGAQCPTANRVCHGGTNTCVCGPAIDSYYGLCQ